MNQAALDTIKSELKSRAGVFRRHANTTVYTVCVCLLLYVFVCFQEDTGEEVKRKKGKPRWASDFMKSSWKENNNAERIFNLLPERDTRCYSALIRGMVMVGTLS